MINEKDFLTFEEFVNQYSKNIKKYRYSVSEIGALFDVYVSAYLLGDRSYLLRLNFGIEYLKHSYGVKKEIIGKCEKEQ